jgi:hypothetical protein
MRAFASLAAVLVLAPAGILAAQVAQPDSGLRIGVMTMRGKAGIATQVSPSGISLAVPEHVTFTVRILPGTRFTQEGQPVSEGVVHPDSAIFVRGLFDMQARTVDAEVIDLMPESRALRMRMENYGRTWTSGVITAVGNGSITIQHLDGSFATLVVSTSSSVLFHSDPAHLSDLRRGEQVDVGLRRNNPSAAETIRIQGRVSGYK